MCYCCATNPSIHHHCCRVLAMSLPLSHHGVAFTIALLQFHHHCHSVAFIIALSQFRCCHHGVTFASVAVLLSPLWCHLHHCIIAVSLSQLHHCCAFAVALLQCLCCRIIVVLSSPSQCHLRHHIIVVFVTILLSPSQCHLHCHIVTVSPSSSHCRGVTFIITLSWCLCCDVVIIVITSSSLSLCCCCCCCCCCCHSCSHCSCHCIVPVIAIVSSLLLSSLLCRPCCCCHHKKDSELTDSLNTLGSRKLQGYHGVLYFAQ